MHSRGKALRKLTALISLAIALILAAAACTGGGEDGEDEKRSALDSVPSDAALLASFQVREALLDTDIQGLFAEFAAAAELEFSTLLAAAADPQEEIGINLVEIEEVLFFASEEVFDEGLAEGILEGRGEATPVAPRIERRLEPLGVPHLSEGTPAPVPVHPREVPRPSEGTPAPVLPRVVESRSVVEQSAGALGDSGALLLTGAYDRNTVIAAMEREQGPLEATVYNGQEILLWRDDDGAIAFVQEDMLVLGSVVGVQAVIDVRQGSRPAVSGALLDSFNALGDPLAKALLNVPEKALRELTRELEEGGSPFGINPGLFQVHSVGLALDKEGERFALMITADYADEASATKASAGLTGLLGFARAFIADEDLGTLLEEVEITSSGSQLRIALTVAPEELGSVIDAVEELGG